MRSLALLFSSVVVLTVPACGEDAATSDLQSDNTPSIPVDTGSEGVAPGTTSTSSSSSSGSSGSAAGTSSSGGTTPPVQGDVDFATKTMTFNGLTRTYLLGTPKGYDAKKAYPVVMLFHGNPGSIDQMRKFAPFEQVSKRDAILVYPAASDGAWDLYTPTATNKDMGFINALPGEIAKSLNVDSSKVYGFGFSGGAFMMAQMACRFGQTTFHAVLINSGGGPQEQQSGYSKRADSCYECPGGPIPTMIVHGDADGQVVKSSGAFTAQCMADQNGCTDFPKTPVSPSPCWSAPGCQKATEWCLVEGMGHQVWDQSMSAAWSFFRAN